MGFTQLYETFKALDNPGFWQNTYIQFYNAWFYEGRWVRYFEGLLTTLEVTVMALALGVILGVVVAVIRTAHDQQRLGNRNPVLGIINLICKVYVTVIRGTPMMVQLLIMGLVIFASNRNKTNIGDLNRDIKAANSLMQSIRQMVRSLKGWLSGLKEKKAALLEALEQAKEPTIPELLSRYLDMRSEERTGWTSKGKLKGTVGDFNKVMEALDFLRQKEISTVESLDAYLDKVSGEILSAKTDIRKSERRIKAIDTTLSHIANHGAYKEVYKKYASIGWKTRKEKFAAEHREELDAYLAAKRFFKAHQEELPFDAKELKKERAQLSEELSKKNEGLQAVQADMRLLRDVRYWINHVLPPDQRRVVPEPGKKPSINEQLSWKIEGAKQREEQKRQQPRRQQKQDMEL